MASNQSIRRIVTHLEPHLDELGAAYLTRRYGQKVWPGIENAPIATKDGSVRLINRKDWLTIGIGEGPFDEHGNGKDATICSADLIARHLGVDRYPDVKLLLDKIRNGDRKGKSSPLDLGQCVRMLNHIGWSAGRIEKWLKVFFDCYFDVRTTIKRKGFKTPPDSIEFPVSDPEIRALIDRDTLLNQWLQKAKLKGEKQTLDCINHLKRELAIITQREPSKMFDLIECISLIAAYHPGNTSIVYQWTAPIFKACTAFQSDFLVACEMIKISKARTIKPAPNCRPSEIIQLLAIDRRMNKSANRRLTSAARMLNRDLDILIIQQPSGNVQIMIMRNHRYNLTPMIARAIRLEEMIADGVDVEDIKLGYELLAQTGKIEISPIWYMPVTDSGEGYAIFNGALTIPNIPSTLIMLDRIVEIISQMVLLNDTESNWYGYAKSRMTLYKKEQHTPATGNKLGDIARIQ